eukprot:TRINITY_DN355_c0_g1_i1.p1 TRINITY_DN355_c0_g1~~TRINITY_DN355_c0_g1_i1.p1  ORF type:complete len:434 (+),score=159.49 TRINITY_DN355_c0_g1_i1:146-1447(+)
MNKEDVEKNNALINEKRFESEEMEFDITDPQENFKPVVDTFSSLVEKRFKESESKTPEEENIEDEDLNVADADEDEPTTQEDPNNNNNNSSTDNNNNNINLGDKPPRLQFGDPNRPKKPRHGGWKPFNYKLEDYPPKPLLPDNSDLLLQQIIRPATADKSHLTPPIGSEVHIHYIARLPHVTSSLTGFPKIFDSSRSRQHDFSFVIGSGEVVQGLDLAVAVMHPGELSVFTIDPSLGYGEIGHPPRVPPNSVIQFEVELLFFKNLAATKAAKIGIPFSERFTTAEGEKFAGNEQFKKKPPAYRQAAKSYNRALSSFNGLREPELTEAELKQLKDFKIALWLNLALCELKTNNAGKAVEYGRKVVEVDAENVKGLFRLGKGLRLKKEWGEAREMLKKAYELDNGVRNDVSLELKLLREEEEVERQNKSMKGFYK